MTGRPKGSPTLVEGLVEERPARCPQCGSTARRVVRVLRQETVPGDLHHYRILRRVTCSDCGRRYHLLTFGCRTAKINPES